MLVRLLDKLNILYRTDVIILDYGFEILFLTSNICERTGMVRSIFRQRLFGTVICFGDVVGTSNNITICLIERYSVQ